MIVIKWAWRYHHLQMETYEGIEDAVTSSIYAADSGSEALEAIEIIEAGVSRRLSDTEYEAFREAEKPWLVDTPERVITHRVEAYYPFELKGHSTWIAYEWCTSREEASKVQATLAMDGFPIERTRIVSNV